MENILKIPKIKNTTLKYFVEDKFIGNINNVELYEIITNVIEYINKTNDISILDKFYFNCINNSNDGCAEKWFNHHKKQISDIVNSLVNELESIKKLERELPHLKLEVKNKTKELINLMRRLAITKYNMIVDEIVSTFTEYFEYIK